MAEHNEVDDDTANATEDDVDGDYVDWWSAHSDEAKLIQRLYWAGA